MTRNRHIQIAAVVVLIASVFAASMMVPSITRQRKDLQLGGAGIEEGDNLPPKEVIFAAGLGVFRGLYVDYLWYRINELKESGKFFEINQDAEQITTLQPRFPQVWSFHAWNMAYNVSVMTHTPDERWDWVSKGIALLRDKGIPYNPRAIRLYRELGWIFFHKVGQFSDDMTWYYKTQLAHEWQEILGTQNEGGKTEDVIASFKKIVDAPDTLDELKSKTPAVVPLLEQLKTLGVTPDLQLLKHAGRIIMVTYSADASLLGVNTANFAGLGPTDRKLAAIMQDPKFAPGVEPLLAHLRKRTLIDHYHMDPAYMLELMHLFGPLDWRHPASHAAYWASLGTKMAAALRKSTKVGVEQVDLVNTYRGSIHAMQELMFRGRIVYDPVSGSYDLLPDPRFIDAYETAKFKADTEILASGLYGHGTTENFNAGHENFLLAAIVFSYLYGDVDKAQEYYKRLQNDYGTLPERVRSGKYMQPLESLVFNEVQDNWQMSAYAGQMIDGMLTHAISEGLATGRMDVFNRFMSLAKMAFDKYDKDAKGVAVSDKVRERRATLPWDERVIETYIDYLKIPSLNPLARFRIWANTPNGIRRPVYDRIKVQMQTLATQAGLDPELAFAEPPEMAEYRKAHPTSAQPQKAEPESPSQTERQ